MLNKQEVLELLGYQVYKVELRLLVYPYVSEEETFVIGGVKIDTSKPSIDQEFYHYIHTEESKHKSIFDRGYTTYYLQIRDGAVFEVDRQSLKELGDVVDVETKSIVYGVTDDGLYKIHKMY